MRGINDARVQRIVGDVDSVSFLIDRLNEFLAGVVQKASTDLLDVQMASAVVRVFLSLEKTWSATPGFSPDNVRDLDPAEKFLVDFFYPLLDATSLNDEMLSGSPNFVTGRAFTQSMTEAYAPFLTKLEGILAATGFSQDQSNLVLGTVIGAVLVCSFPLWVVYRDFHGYAAYDTVVPRLLDAVSVAGFVLNDMRSNLLESASPTQAGDFDLVVSQLDVSFRQSLNQKANPYIKAFKENAESIFRVRTRPKDSELKTAIENVKFWKNVSAGKTTIYLGPEPGDPNDVALSYLGGIYFNANEETQKRSFLAVSEAWAALEQASRFVSQAGFWLYVNAANNPYSGRHPPHNTHENGGDFDLGWTYVYNPDPNHPTMDPRDPKNHRENLAHMKTVEPQPGLPIFTDPRTNKDFSLVPIPEDKDTPPTHAQIQKLAAHVVLQAVALSGLKRYLYADAQNMRYAATNLGSAMSYFAKKLGVADPNLNPWESTRKAVIAFTEAMSHYNHLHAELFARGVFDPGPLLKEANLASILTFMYELALERDNDDAFYAEMFQPRKGVEKDESEAKIKPLRDDWKNRSNAKMPSLLPVWLTEERWNQFREF